MAKLIRIIRDGEDLSRDDWIHNLPDNVLVCRAQQHAWPRIKRQGRLPRGLRATVQRDGVFQLEYECPDCHTVRITNTLPGGVIEHPRTYTYRYPEGFKSPKGSEITRRELFDELWRRTAEDIAAQAAREADPEQVPAAVFSG